MSLIGITGKIGSGKTTISDYLQTQGYTEYSMANPLKKIGEIFHFDAHQLYGSQEQKMEINPYWGISSRHFLQKFGTDICRDYLPKVIPEMNISPTIWVRLFDIERTKNPTKKYVVSDVRFVDEATYIKQAGGIIIRVVRDTDRSTSEHKHSSEVEQEKIEADFTINNNNTIRLLQNTVHHYVLCQNTVCGSVCDNDCETWYCDGCDLEIFKGEPGHNPDCGTWLDGLQDI